MRVSRILATPFMLLVLVSCSSPSKPSPAQSSPTQIVSGQVSDFVTGAPLAGRQFKFDAQQIVTDGNGRYSIEVATGEHSFRLDSGETGSISARHSPTKGDVLANFGDCTGRYGVVFDATTGRPIAGVKVDVAQVGTTDADGWYRVVSGCNRTFYNTTFFTANAPGYEGYSEYMGRDVSGFVRKDIGLNPLR